MPRGGARDGAGRPPRTEPKSRPIWCGQMSEEDRALVMAWLTPQERGAALIDAVAWKQSPTMAECFESPEGSAWAIWKAKGEG